MTSTSFSLEVDDSRSVSAEVYLPDAPKAMFVFAHGAGADMQHAFMKSLSEELAHHRIATLRYNFLYMELNRKRPDFPAVAHQAVAAALRKAIGLFPELPLYAGGKSFGGRMTSQFLVNNQMNVRGLIFVGFPLHPAGKPSINRADHLQNIKLPMLFLQGTKDTLAEWNLLEGICKSLPSATLVKLEGADHAFKMPKQNSIPILAAEISRWIDGLNQ